MTFCCPASHRTAKKCRKCRIKCRIYFLPPSIQKPLILRASQSIFLQSVAMSHVSHSFLGKKLFFMPMGVNSRSTALLQRDFQYMGLPVNGIKCFVCRYSLYYGVGSDKTDSGWLTGLLFFLPLYKFRHLFLLLF